MQAAKIIAIILVIYTLQGCHDSKREASEVQPEGTGAEEKLSPLSIDEAEQFVKSWCGGGILTNFRKLDADKFLISDDMPAWLNVEKDSSWDIAERGDQSQFIRGLKDFPIFNAMLPKGNMILADFSSGSDCGKTLVAVDALAAAYLKKLRDASHAYTPICESSLKDGYRSLTITSPKLTRKLDNSGLMSKTHISGITKESGQCDDEALAHVLVGHSNNKLTISHVTGNWRKPSLLNFLLISYIIEADGSAQFLQSDGALKFFSQDFSTLWDTQPKNVEPVTCPLDTTPPTE